MEIKSRLEALHAMCECRRMEIDGRFENNPKAYDILFDALDMFFNPDNKGDDVTSALACGLDPIYVRFMYTK